MARLSLNFLNRGYFMNRFDVFLMDATRHIKRFHYKSMFFIMFRKKAQCKHFCLTCNYFDSCMNDVKALYQSEKSGQNQRNSNNK